MPGILINALDALLDVILILIVDSIVECVLQIEGA
jgi:hypothetical protein